MKSLSLLVAALAVALPAFAGDPSSCSSCGTSCSESPTAGMLSTYEKVAGALAADNLADAKVAATNLACCLTCGGAEELSAKVEALAAAKDLAGARALFKGISAAIIPLVEKAGDHYVMTCPMAGADWIQATPEVANPYYGSKMPHCGAVKKTVKTDS